jgi:DnaJ-class molecular chaperone
MTKHKSTCKECAGKGYVQGTVNRAACLFCHGSGDTTHGPRLHNLNLMNVMKWCEDYINGKKDGGYH